VFGKDKPTTIEHGKYRSKCSYCNGVGFPLCNQVIECPKCKAVWANYELDF